ncbi:hypothetical protein E4T44_00423 [Aureobasidium sp. EXF-8845]|nr:hypothetical protein E4T44_00423 [Aureobasidium sp. EXF-8845]
MSPADFKIFNRLAVQMNFYHSILRESWDELYTGTAKGARHHDIEESYWFPILGKRMEGFRGSGFAKEQHRAMHKGLDVLAPYLQECKRGERELRREEVREIMDSFGGILWTHLDEEVRELGAENMQKYWTKNEMRNFPF